MKHVLISLLLFLPTYLQAYDYNVDGIFYDLHDDGTATVTSGYYSGEVIIPVEINYDGKMYSVTSIGEEAFYRCSSLTSITIPERVTTIGHNAFMGCSGLKAVHITNLASWCNISFGDYYSPYYSHSYYSNPLSYAHHLYLNGEEVKDLVIPNSVTSIGESAFYGCSGLTSITIPESVTTIGGGSFYGCSGLTAITIPNSVTSIGEFAFESCIGLTSITIPESVTTIGYDAFYGCSLTSVNITDLASWCNIDFENSYSKPFSYHHLYLNGEEVTDLVIPNSVTSIRYRAFYGCTSLTSVTIPNSVTGIGGDAFHSCI